ncbi:unnamed protein product [Boreogadus saida]
MGSSGCGRGPQHPKQMTGHSESACRDCTFHISRMAYRHKRITASNFRLCDWGTSMSQRPKPSNTLEARGVTIPGEVLTEEVPF